MARVLLFLSSLAPVFLIVGIRLLGSIAAVGIGIVVLGVVLFCVALLVFVKRGKVTSRPIVVTGIRDESYQIPIYLLTFVFPFLFIELKNSWDAAAYIVLILLVLLLLFRTDLSLVNPVLLVLGYHIYAVEAAGGEDLLLIAKNRPRVGGHILGTLLSGNTYLLDLQGTGE